MDGVSPRLASTLKMNISLVIVLILKNYKLVNICHVFAARPGSMLGSLPSLKAAFKGRVGQGILFSAKKNSWRDCLRTAFRSKCQVLASLWSV